MGALRLGSGIGLVVAFIFNIIALATPAWITAINYSCGLITCLIGSVSINVTRTAAENVAMAFNILAMITLLGAFVLVLVASKNEDKDTLGKIGAILGIVSAVLIMIGMAAYTGLMKKGVLVSIPWGYSYAFGWVAFCLALICGVVSLIGK